VGSLAAAIVVWLSASTAASPSAEEILSGNAPPADYGKRVRCVVAARIEKTEALSNRFIVFYGVRDELWLTQLRRPCPGLTPNSDLMFERRGSYRICEFDTVRTVRGSLDPGSVFARPGANPDLGVRCMLPEFEAVTPNQVALLKREIRAARKHPPKAPPQ
jgi:hypothetical protein